MVRAWWLVAAIGQFLILSSVIGSGELLLCLGQDHGRELHRALGEQDHLLHS